MQLAENRVTLEEGSYFYVYYLHIKLEELGEFKMPVLESE